MNSETPETDAACFTEPILGDSGFPPAEVELVPADFARRLELRNRRLVEALHSITQDNDHLSIRCSENEYDDACPKCRAQAALDQQEEKP